MSTKPTVAILFAFGLITAVPVVSAQGQTTCYVDDDCTVPGSGLPTDPFCTIQEGIDACDDGDTVVVAEGVYTGTGNKNLDFGGKAITVLSESGPETCTIDCEGSGRAFHFHTGETATSVVDGFTITNGNTTDGGAMYIDACSPLVTNCMFVGNRASDGGAVHMHLSSMPSFVNCLFLANSATDDGGAMQITSSSAPQIANCVFIGNTAAGSLEDDGGGAIVVWGGNPTLTNCTFAYNHSDDQGGAIYNRDFLGIPTSLEVANCIFWSNSDAEGTDESAQIHDEPDSPSTVTYTCIQGLDIFAGNGNIDADPLFVRNPDPGSDGEWGGVDDDFGDVRLGSGSPCIDAGDTSVVPAGLFVDLDGKGRVLDDPLTPDTGVAASLIPVTVDLGAYEYQQLLDGDCDSDAACPRADVNCDGIVDGFDIAEIRSGVCWLQ